MENLDYNTKYANWNNFYEDLESEIKKIRAVGNKIRFDIDIKELLLHQYFSMISDLYSTHSSYIINKEKILKDLNKIEDFIFSSKFLNAVKDNPERIKLVKLKITRDLRKIFTHMCNSFSIMGIRPKIEEIDITKYSDTLPEGEEKREAQFFEQMKFN